MRPITILQYLMAALVTAAAPQVFAITHRQDDTGVVERASLEHALHTRIKATFDEQRLVGLSAGIVLGGELVETIHFGHEDRERAIAADDDTMYRWASISKPLTAIAAMQLVATGTLDLNADVRKYVPEFPPKSHVTTPQQLLCHQGGIVHYSNGPVIRTERAYTEEHPFADTVLALDLFKESPLVCEPGTQMSYTTHGYMLLGAVVARAGGRPFVEQVNERIATPLGLTTLQADYEWVDIPNRAVGYERRFDVFRAVRSSDVSWKLPGGGFVSNVRDLANFAATLTRMDEQLLARETYTTMWTPQPTSDGTFTAYGFGFGIGRVAGTNMLRVAHSGSQQKTRTQMVICPQTQDGVVIMCNSQWAELGGLANNLLQLLVEASAKDITPADEDDQFLPGTSGGVGRSIGSSASF